jgi:hypothetical protein
LPLNSRLASRRVTDLPVRLVIVARRFRCGVILCGRRIFTERFEGGVLAPWARRTARLDYVVHHLGLALGGRPAASFAQRLMFPVSNDRLLRAVSPSLRSEDCGDNRQKVMEWAALGASVDEPRLAFPSLNARTNRLLSAPASRGPKALSLRSCGVFPFPISTPIRNGHLLAQRPAAPRQMIVSKSAAWWC